MIGVGSDPGRAAEAGLKRRGMSIGLECEDFGDGSSGREAMRPVAAAVRLCDRSAAIVARETVRAALITREHVALGKAVVAE